MDVEAGDNSGAPGEVTRFFKEQGQGIATASVETRMTHSLGEPR